MEDVRDWTTAKVKRVCDDLSREIDRLIMEYRSCESRAENSYGLDDDIGSQIRQDMGLKLAELDQKKRDAKAERDRLRRILDERGE